MQDIFTEKEVRIRIPIEDLKVLLEEEEEIEGQEMDLEGQWHGKK